MTSEVDKIERLSKKDPKAFDRIIEVQPRQESERMKTQAGAEIDDDGNGLAYKDINVYAYYAVTLLLYFLIVLMGSTLPSVDIVFDFLGCVTVDAIGFVMPAVFYLKGREIYAKNIQSGEGPYEVSR